MKIQCFTGGPFFTNGFLVEDEEKGVCALFDAPHDTYDDIVKYIQGHSLTLDAIYLTHSHFDHLGSLAKLKNSLGVKVYIHPLDRENVVMPGSDRVPLMIPTEGVVPDEELADGQALHIGSIEFRVIATPGHSPGSVSFFFPKHKFVINGDLIFKSGRGRTDLPGCDEDVLYQSMKKIFDLGDDITIFSGHGDKTTVREERNQL